MISGDLIREARLRAGLSQAELGRRLGKHPTAISRWERDVASPSLETLRGVVRACGLELTLGLANADENGHDTALIERSLRLEPAARLREGVNEARALERMDRHVRGTRDG